MFAVVGETCERAWLEVAEHLAERKCYCDYNVAVEIERPDHHDRGDHRLRKVVDQFLGQAQAARVATVAGTVFPAAEYLECGSRGVYEVYPNEVYPEILSPGDWGRYAYRLVRWPPSEEKPTLNPLKELTEKIKEQRRQTGPKRACYELSLTDTAIDLPLYDPRSDKGRIMGGPCLSHLSFKLGPDDTLYLTALYRSHYYVARALGNFLGLAAVQAFVCNEVELSPGSLFCVSTFAKLDTLDKRGGRSGWGIRDAKDMISAARSALEGEQA